MADSQHWGVVGGGILGLALAHRLRRQGRRVTIIEAAPHLGGLADACRHGDVTWDRFYHVILMSDLHVRSLLEEIGLADEMQWVETKTGFYTDGRLYSMSNSLEFLRFPPLGLIDKFRLGWTIFRASKIKNWRRLERIPVVDWLRKLSGNRTTEKIWLPLLRAKLGDNYKVASAAFLWAIIARMYAARRSGLKKEMFGYVRGGYNRIISKWEKRLRADGVEFVLGRRVEQVDSGASGPTVSLVDGASLSFDRVAITAAAPLAANLCPYLTQDERDCLNKITYQGIVCASVLLKKQAERFYVTNITETDIPFTAVIEMTALVNPQEFDGKHLVYLPKYVAPTDPMFQESDESIRSRFLTAFLKMYPHLSMEDVLAFHVSRVRNVFAVSTLNYSLDIPPYSTSLPGVFLVNSSQIANGTLNVNETLQLADQALPTLMSNTVSEAKPASREAITI